MKSILKKLLLMGLCVLLLGGCKGKNETVRRPSPTPRPEPTPVTTPAPAPAPLYGISDYFPITENTLYKYAGIGLEMLEQQMYTLFSSEDGMQVLTENKEDRVTDVYKIEDGQLKVIYNDLAYYYDNLLDTKDVRHIVVLKEPLEVGNSWEYNPDGAVCRITGMDVKVEVPYGEFEAMEVTINHDGGTIQRDYYARGVGLVKTGYTVEGGEISMELEDIITDTIKESDTEFYVVNTTKDQQEIEKRMLALSTNMDFTEYFNTELKKVKSIDYQPLLTGESKILSLSVDWVNVLLIVDLSADYVTELDAGAGIEGSVLQALANTLGNFYRVNNVEILLEGKPYQSGHISKPDGEYWAVEKPAE